MNRLAAILGLAAEFALHLLRLPLRFLRARGGARSSGLRRFLRNYAPDGFVPVTAEERDIFPAFSRCIACGLCDLPSLEAAARRPGASPETLALALSRFLAQTSDANADLDAGSLDRRCREIEAVCPTRVPVARLARFVKERAAAHARLLEQTPT